MFNKLSEITLKASKAFSDLDIKVMRSDIERCDKRIIELEKEIETIKKIRETRIKEYAAELNSKGLGIEEILGA